MSILSPKLSEPCLDSTEVVPYGHNSKYPADFHGTDLVDTTWITKSTVEINFFIAHKATWLRTDVVSNQKLFSLMTCNWIPSHVTRNLH